ncbi:MAG: T9SS type A sorting domain-containing protein, partial [Bacteroidota bacterium]
SGIIENKAYPDLLKQNFPNPFQITTTISFELPNPEFASLTIRNCLGQKLVILVNGKLSEGTHSFEWNAKTYPSGIYYYSLQLGDRNFTKRMILIN